MNNELDDATRRVLDKLHREFPIPPEKEFAVWPVPPLNILDCVLSLNRRYDEFCLPRVEKFANQHPEITTLAALLKLIESYPTPLDFSVTELNYRDEIRAATLVSLLKSLLQVEKAFKDSEETSRLKAWAASVRPTDYEKFGVRGFGLSGFQYLRMLLGVQTIKPDVHIRRFVSDAIGRSVEDEEALALMEAAGNHLEWPLSRLDYAIWDRGARGNENQNSPLYAIALLDELQRDGFTDSSFKIIHHFGRKATIQSYCDYCRESVSSFQDDGTNERVCKRLQIIQNAFKAGGFTTPAKPGVFEALAMAARLETSLE